MPILWRFLLSQFFKVTLVCIVAFISILLTMRLDEIAHFASLGASLSDILLFSAYQIPYILPIALPISCLISSMILVQRLSKTHELTALRACGMGLSAILTPLLLSAAFLMLLNFYIVSEVATKSHLTTNTLKNKLRSVNPLLLLHNKHLMRLKGIYFNTMGSSRLGEYVSDAVIAVPNRSNNRINLFVAKQLIANSNAFIGKQATLITCLKGDEIEGFDPILIENVDDSATLVSDFADVLQKKGWKINNDYLSLSLLLARIHEQQEQIEKARLESRPIDEIKVLKSQYHLSLAEIARRVSISIAAFSFTLMGCSFGLSIGRKLSYRSIYIVVALATLFLVAFFTAKGLEKNWILASLLYLLPHGLIIISSITVLNRISNGIE